MHIPRWTPSVYACPGSVTLLSLTSPYLSLGNHSSSTHTPHFQLTSPPPQEQGAGWTCFSCSGRLFYSFWSDDCQKSEHCSSQASESLLQDQGQWFSRSSRLCKFIECAGSGSLPENKPNKEENRIQTKEKSSPEGTWLPALGEAR